MQAKGQGEAVDYSHDISNCPEMIAKFSRINLTSAANQEDSATDSEENQDYVDFYEQDSL